MLRRLTERHKCHALHLLTGTSDSHRTLYGLPHRDDLVSRASSFHIKFYNWCLIIHSDISGDSAQLANKRRNPTLQGNGVSA